MSLHTSSAVMDSPQLPDMPAAWLSSMALALDKPSTGWTHGQLFRACRRLRQVLCDQLAIRPVLSVNSWSIRKLGTTGYVKALALIEAGAPARLRLCLWMTHMAWLRDVLTQAAQLAQQSQPEQPAAAPVLSCITAISISWGRDIELRPHSLVPGFLVQLCPSLEELNFKCLIVMATEDASQLTCSSLRTLSLQHVHFEGNQPSAVFQQQLLNLPSLTALEFNWAGRKTQYEPGSALSTAVGRYSSQLTALSLSHRSVQQFWPQGTQFALLQELRLPKTVIKGDAAMQQLLAAAPNLRLVELSSIKGLTTSFAHVSPGWRELQLHDVYIAELPKIPLAKNALFTAASYWLSGATRVDPNPGAVRAGLVLLHTTVTLQHHLSTDINLHVHDVECLKLVAPILPYNSRTVALTFVEYDYWHSPWPERRALLAALGPHLKSEQVMLEWANWLPTPGSLAEVPELLPHVKQFVMTDFTPAKEAVKMAEAATRPFKLHLLADRPGEPGDEERIRDVVRAVGNPPITVVGVDG